jgi:hypothetical protein
MTAIYTYIHHSKHSVNTTQKYNKVNNGIY